MFVFEIIKNQWPQGNQQQVASHPVRQWASYTVTAIGDVYQKLKEKSESRVIHHPAFKQTQTKILAATCSIADISAVCFQPYAAVTGVILSSAMPERSLQLTGVVTGAIQDSWGKLSFEHKIVFSVCIMIASYTWLPILTTIATLYSVKVGADFTNHRFVPHRRE